MMRINQCVGIDKRDGAGAGSRVTLAVALTDDIWAAMGKTRGRVIQAEGRHMTRS